MLAFPRGRRPRARGPRAAAWLAPLAALLACGARAQDASDAQAARAWNQPRGEADLSGRCDVEPIVRTPVEAWKVGFKELHTEPVVWGGTVFVVGVQQREPMLYAYDLASGKSVAAAARLPAQRTGWLAVWRGFVALVQPDAVLVLSLRGGQFAGTRKSIPLARGGPPTVLAGKLFVCDSNGGVHCIDLEQGTELARFAGGNGQPAVVATGAGGALIATVGSGKPRHPDRNLEYVGRYLTLRLQRATGLDTPAPSFESTTALYHAQFAEATLDEGLRGAFPLCMGKDPRSAQPLWLAYSPPAILGEAGAAHLAIFPSTVADIAAPPIALAGTAYGFSREGDFVQVLPDGRFRLLVERDPSLGGRRRVGSASEARGVLYLENWALRLEDKRVLWELPALAPRAGLIPAGDGLALYTSAKNELVCLRDPGPEKDAAAGARAGPAPAPARARPSVPGSGEAVVLRSGERLAGKVEREPDGSVRLLAERGGPRRFAREELALIETASGLERLGPERALHRAARAPAVFEHLEALAQAIEIQAQAGQIDEARRLVGEAQAFGADAEALRALERRLSGRIESTDRNAAAQRAYGLKEESKLREKSAQRFLQAARWCRELGQRQAASALFADALRVQPALPGVQDEVRALLPAGLPWAGAVDAPERWMALAGALLATSAEVVGPADLLRARLGASSWGATAVIVRSANLELVSREYDPAVIGNTLRLGERAIEILGRLLGPGQGASKAALEVRLHASRADYLEELRRQGGPPTEWMVGHYSPDENVSRFYVTREEGLARDPRMRELDRVLVHELTHHFLAARWLAGRDAPAGGDGRSCGFWIVEGFARFVEDQVVEMDRRGESFDDASVSSLDVSRSLAAAGQLIPPERLLRLSQRDFWTLSDEPLADVQLQNTLASGRVSERMLFYDESAALVFFLCNRAGPERARRVVEFLRRWYEQELPADPWKLLGYAEAQELALDFSAFLAEPGPK